MIFYAIELAKRVKDISFCRYDGHEYILLSKKELEELVKEFQLTVVRKEPTRTLPQQSHASGEDHSLGQQLKSALKTIAGRLPEDVAPPLKTMILAAINVGRCILYPKTGPSKMQSVLSECDSTSMKRMRPFPFHKGDILFVMGLLWSHLPYDRFAREMHQIGFHVVTVIHDLIPVIFPEVFDNNLQDQHLELVINGSSLLMAVSDHTAADIAAFATRRGILLPRLRRIRWGNELGKPAPRDTPRRFESLTPGKFVLYVSTLTYRKNHEMLYGIWRDLYECERETLIPLALVGQVGVQGEAFLQLLHKTRRLYPEFIKHFTDVNDTELAWLYTNCRFTVFPSFYEGWGLPVCEAMGYGKVCISADATSLVEVGSGLTERILPFDYYGWKERILAYIKDDALLRAGEAAIKASYLPMSWQESVNDFVLTLEHEFPGIFKKL